MSDIVVRLSRALGGTSKTYNQAGVLAKKGQPAARKCMHRHLVHGLHSWTSMVTAQQSATRSYVIDEIFPHAVAILRQALRQADLDIVSELDLARHLRTRLTVSVPECVAIFVTGPASTGEVTVLGPFHIVAAARGERTEVHLLRSVPTNSLAWEAAVLRAMTSALEKIGRPKLE